ncbi:MAG: hypothetical protein CK424_00990 [Legionella sp.]|nr:MAG: hypothetical protein CK424_00990 [Legionella sp.]
MKASEILMIAEKWKKVFDTLKTRSNLNQQDLAMLAWINGRLIVILQAEVYLHKERTELANRPEAPDITSPLHVHFLHINNILNHYPSEESEADRRRWLGSTPYQLHQFREATLGYIMVVAQLKICRDLFLLWSHNALTFAAVSQLYYLMLPLIIIVGVLMLIEKRHYRFDNHSFNLVMTPPGLNRDPILSTMRSHNGLTFFENPVNQSLIQTIDEEYQRANAM